MTPVKNQGSCGSCVAFAAVGALEGQLKTQTNNPSWNIDLSEQHLFSCGGGSCSKGWYLSSALNYLKQYGTPDEACSPYLGASGSCSNSCPNWQSRAYKISSWNWVTATPEAIEAALQNGPLLTRFDVYTDFFSYSGGVYHYTSGSRAGGHAVTIVGYDSIERYWIVKNSWGSSWGESGYFRIGFGEVGIDQSAATIKTSVASYTVTFFDDPADGAIVADGLTMSSGVAGSYGVNQRVHVLANPPNGYKFSYWEPNGVTVDSTSSADTYMTVSGNGWLKAYFSLDFSSVIPVPLSSISSFTASSAGSTLLLTGDIAVNPQGTKRVGVGFQAGRDTTPLGFVSGMLDTSQLTVFDTNTAYVDTSTGRPIGDWPLIFSVGGPLSNAVTYYYEHATTPADKAPVKLSIPPGDYAWTDRNGVEVARVSQSSTSVPPGSSDVFVIQILRDADGRLVVLMYGTCYVGVWAAAWYFKFMVYPTVSSWQDSYYIVRWTDAASGASANRTPDAGDAFTILAQG
jgi:hypothetical protein